MMRVKKNDTVAVIAGKDKGKQGLVIDVSPKSNQVLVQGVSVVTKHVKARKQGQVAGIKKQETYINMSKVMPICQSCKNPCRVNTKVLETGLRQRVCNSCKEVI